MISDIKNQIPGEITELNLLEVITEDSLLNVQCDLQVAQLSKLKIGIDTAKNNLNSYPTERLKKLVKTIVAT